MSFHKASLQQLSMTQQMFAEGAVSLAGSGLQEVTPARCWRPLLATEDSWIPLKAGPPKRPPMRAKEPGNSPNQRHLQVQSSSLENGRGGGGGNKHV